MTKPQATLYWHTTYRRESNNVIRSSKRQLIMKLVMNRCHAYTHIPLILNVSSELTGLNLYRGLNCGAYKSIIIRYARLVDRKTTAQPEYGVGVFEGDY